MALFNLLGAVSEPTGFWPTIIKAFESGVGSYILAIVLITLIIRVIWAPFDTINKKISKKNARLQAELQPELEKIKAKYGNDKNLLSRKTQELYRKNNVSMGGSLGFMLIFLTLNLLIFFTLFSGLNGMADYKISQEYEYLKNNYANVLNLSNQEYDNNNFSLFENYENITFKIDGEDFVAYNGETEIARTTYKSDFSYTIQVEEKDEEGNVVIGDDGQPKMVDKVITNDEVIFNIAAKLVAEQPYLDAEGNQIVDTEGNAVANPNYKGNTKITVGGTEYNLNDTINYFADSYMKDVYKNKEEKSSFLWISNYWVADSPFKSSIFTYDQYVSEIGSSNVSEYEKTIYNAFMPALSKNEGRVNGYFILALLSVGVSLLSVYVGNLSNRKKGQPVATNKTMTFIMPIIMGIFALFYNSVFAIYLVVSQAINTALAPLENLIIDKWEAHDKKKKDEKLKSVVDYRRK